LRVRDLRWHILACIILIFSYAGIAICFYLSISSGKVQDSMKILGLEAVEEVKKEVENKVTSDFDIYESDVTDTFVYETGSESTEGKKFELFASQDNDTISSKLRAQGLSLDGTNSGFIIASAYNIEKQSANSRNYDYYIYFAKPISDESDFKDTIEKYNTTGYILTRIKLSTFLSFITHDIMIFNTADSNVTYTDIDQDEFPIKERENYITDYVGDTYKSLIDTNGNINGAYTISGKTFVISAVYSNLKGIGFATVLDIDNVFLGIQWVYQQAIIFYVSGVIISLLMLAVMILGCYTTSKLLRADRHALQKTEAIVIRVDLSGNLIFSNKTFKMLYGVTREVNIKDFLDVETNEPIINTIKKNKAFICEIPLDEIRDRVAYLQLTPLEISRSYYLMGTDITLDYNESQRLQKMSGKNEVTMCDNGFILANKFEKIIKEDTNGMDVAFIEFNIHKYNDLIQIFGRTTYNLVLIEFLKLLKEHFPDLNIYHKDISKFIVVYPNTDMSEIAPHVEEFLETLKKPVAIKGNNIYINAKIVAYDLKRDAIDASYVNMDEDHQISLKTIEEKLDLAYRNMGELSSKDYVVYESAMDNIILATDEMERDIETGLIDKEFQMWLQPQFDIINNRVAGFEALIRWMNPKYRDKSPQIFIELAEKRGHMLDIGRFVITESFKLAKKLEPYNIHISVNVSPVQLLQVGFVQQLIDEFNKNQLKTGSIAIEITETLLMGSFKLVAEKLRLLKEAGFHIHLDDFCTGYSSMLYLKDLPVDTLKIDKEFTKYIVTNKFNENIVKTICTLAKDLDLDLVCEGVESQEQADMVKKFGCRVIQGYLYGKAMPYDQAVEMLEQYNISSKRR
jgi:EAL domain-containing protein (putative c-di-GMP-specific phosphodiesterase class I)/GGDEF domain-containing protein